MNLSINLKQIKMKNQILKSTLGIVMLTLLSIGCSSDDNSNQTNETINYSHEVIYVANDSGSSSSDILVKANHTSTQGNPIEETKTITVLLDKLSVVLDNSNNPIFTITNNGPTSVYIQFVAIRGDGNGNFPSPNENEEDFEFQSGQSGVVIYNYNVKKYQIQ